MSRVWGAGLLAVWVGLTGCKNTGPEPEPGVVDPPLEEPTPDESDDSPTEFPQEQPPPLSRRPVAPDLSAEPWRFPNPRQEHRCAPAHATQLCSADCFCWEGDILQGNRVRALWSWAPDHVWAAAGRSLLFWNGKTWTRAAGVQGDFLGVWGSGPKDVWAVGHEGRALHWVWGTGPDDVWVNGVYLGYGNPSLMHWNGREWRPVDTGVSWGVQSLGGTRGQVWGISESGLLRLRPAP